MGFVTFLFFNQVALSISMQRCQYFLLSLCVFVNLYTNLDNSIKKKKQMIFHSYQKDKIKFGLQLLTQAEKQSIRTKQWKKCSCDCKNDSVYSQILYKYLIYFHFLSMKYRILSSNSHNSYFVVANDIVSQSKSQQDALKYWHLKSSKFPF